MTRLKSTLILCAALLIAFSAAPLFAASGMTGKWTTDMKMQDGSSFTLAFDFKQDGTKLTGTVTGPQGDPLAIDNGALNRSLARFQQKHRAYLQQKEQEMDRLHREIAELCHAAQLAPGKKKR